MPLLNSFVFQKAPETGLNKAEHFCQLGGQCTLLYNRILLLVNCKRKNARF